MQPRAPRANIRSKKKKKQKNPCSTGHRTEYSLLTFSLSMISSVSFIARHVVFSPLLARYEPQHSKKKKKRPPFAKNIATPSPPSITLPLHHNPWNIRTVRVEDKSLNLLSWCIHCRPRFRSNVVLVQKRGFAFIIDGRSDKKCRAVFGHGGRMGGSVGS